MESTVTVRDNLTDILARIERTACRAGRNPADISLVAATKTQPIERVQQVIAGGGVHIGENYIQEAREKIERLAHLPVLWHLIGHLQTNKAKYAVRMFDLIHTVDSLKLAVELDRQAGKAGKRQAVLVQVNISGEGSKSGLSADQTKDLVREIKAMPHLLAKGLMTIPPFFHAPEQSRPIFATLKQLLCQIHNDLSMDNHFKELSMGMTGDFEVAIEEGATLVRVGTALFGERR
jgi:pyridoxal phosphate enzyme (YggS family)